MIAAEIPANELERLQALYKLNILDTPAEPRFDRITELARGYFGVKASLINLVDEDRQWAKSCMGIASGDASRDISFCAYTILQDAEFIVENALMDARFHDGPFVTGDFGLRFYAGYPLHTPDGMKVGSLCLAHPEPRAMTDRERAALRQFASLAEDELNRVHVRDTMAQLASVEESLERERGQLRAIIERVPVAMALIDGERRFVAHSATWMTDYELPGKNVIGQRLDDVLPESADRWRAVHAHVMDGKPMDAKEECIVVDGKPTCVQWAAVPFRGPDSMIDGMVLVTDRIDELVEARETALNATRQKGEFLARMSHEIRTPMNGVIGMLDMLLDTSMSETQHDYATLARDSSYQLLTIINDILDLSKIEAGKLTIEAIPFAIPKTVEDVVNLLRTNAVSKGLDLRVVLDPALPRMVVGDGHRLRQVLLNLIGNALKFTANGYVEVTASPGQRQNEREVVQFAVRDTGIGLSAEAQGRLFKPFEQADGATTRNYGGTGLGLSICKELVTLMGGTIAVDSVQGQGSTFCFDLPYTVAEAPAAPVAKPRVVIQRTASSQPILLVDDNAVNRKLALLQLQKLGYRARAVEDGAQAVDAVRDGDYCMVLMDCQMPVMDGFTATTTIRRMEQTTGKHIPIVAMTASVMAEERDACLAAGMDDFVSKPIRLSVLQAMIERWTKAMDDGKEGAYADGAVAVSER